VGVEQESRTKYKAARTMAKTRETFMVFLPWELIAPREGAGPSRLDSIYLNN
jgi:hypothetical protein